MVAAIRIAVCLMVFVGAAGAQTPPQPPRVTDQARAALQAAASELERVHSRLGDLVSDCSGGNVLVRACGPNPQRVENACHEPLTTCEVVDAFKASGAALEAVRKALAQ